MHARVETNWVNRTVKIWLWTTAMSNEFVLHKLIGPDTWEDEVIDVNAVIPEPSLTLHYEMVKALLPELMQFKAPSEAQASHLADVIGVRDRLLTLVEKHHA
jgi:hypothetical protein